MLSENRNEAIALFKGLHELAEEIDFSISNTKRLSDEQLRRKIYTLTKIQAHEIAIKSKTERNQILKLLRQNGLTTGQLERLTGISRGIISRV